jgi:hypothetical protein
MTQNLKILISIMKLMKFNINEKDIIGILNKIYIFRNNKNSS